MTPEQYVAEAEAHVRTVVVDGVPADEVVDHLTAAGTYLSLAEHAAHATAPQR